MPSDKPTKNQHLEEVEPQGLEIGQEYYIESTTFQGHNYCAYFNDQMISKTVRDEIPFPPWKFKAKYVGNTRVADYNRPFFVQPKIGANEESYLFEIVKSNYTFPVKKPIGLSRFMPEFSRYYKPSGIDLNEIFADEIANKIGKLTVRQSPVRQQYDTVMRELDKSDKSLKTRKNSDLIQAKITSFLKGGVTKRKKRTRRKIITRGKQTRSKM
jgi:hypothetical protein